MGVNIGFHAPRCFLYITFLIFTTCTTARSETVSHANDFLLLGAGARALGMGGAYCSISDDASAPVFNPAGMTGIPIPELGTMYSNRGEIDTTDLFISYIRPSQQGCFGVSFFRTQISDIPITRELNSNEKSLLSQGFFPDIKDNNSRTASNNCLIFSYAFKQGDNKSFGFNAKYLYMDLVDMITARGAGLDAGMIFTPMSNLSTGLVFNDIFNSTKLKGSPSNLNGKPTISHYESTSPGLKFGTSYRFALNYKSLRSIIFSTDVENMLCPSSMIYHVGSELQFLNTLRLRIGTILNRQDMPEISIGAGLLMSSVSVDYAALQDDFGLNHRISISWKFLQRQYPNKESAEQEQIDRWLSEVIENKKTHSSGN